MSEETKVLEGETVVEKNYFVVLNEIDVSKKTEKKGDLTYLSWAWAWGELKKRHPKANYTVYERQDGCIYWTDGKTCWVKTGVTVEGLEHIEYLPVMDFKNKSILLKDITSFDVNKTIQRSLTKAVARHGLGLYIYAGEDLPTQQNEDGEHEEEQEEPKFVSEETLNFLKSLFNKPENQEKLAKLLDEHHITMLSELPYQYAEDLAKTIRANAKKRQ